MTGRWIFFSSSEFETVALSVWWIVDMSLQGVEREAFLVLWNKQEQTKRPRYAARPRRQRRIRVDGGYTYIHDLDPLRAARNRPKARSRIAHF